MFENPLYFHHNTYRSEVCWECQVVGVGASLTVALNQVQQHGGHAVPHALLLHGTPKLAPAQTYHAHHAQPPWERETITFNPNQELFLVFSDVVFSSSILSL